LIDPQQTRTHFLAHILRIRHREFIPEELEQPLRWRRRYECWPSVCTLQESSGLRDRDYLPNRTPRWHMIT